MPGPKPPDPYKDKAAGGDPALRVTEINRLRSVLDSLNKEIDKLSDAILRASNNTARAPLTQQYDQKQAEFHKLKAQLSALETAQATKTRALNAKPGAQLGQTAVHRVQRTHEPVNLDFTRFIPTPKTGVAPVDMAIRGVYGVLGLIPKALNIGIGLAVGGVVALATGPAAVVSGAVGGATMKPLTGKYSLKALLEKGIEKTGIFDTAKDENEPLYVISRKERLAADGSVEGHDVTLSVPNAQALRTPQEASAMLRDAAATMLSIENPDLFTKPNPTAADLATIAEEMRTRELEVDSPNPNTLPNVQNLLTVAMSTPEGGTGRSYNLCLTPATEQMLLKQDSGLHAKYAAYRIEMDAMIAAKPHLAAGAPGAAGGGPGGIPVHGAGHAAGAPGVGIPVHGAGHGGGALGGGGVIPIRGGLGGAPPDHDAAPRIPVGPHGGGRKPS